MVRTLAACPALQLAPLEIGPELGLESEIALGRLARCLFLARPLLCLDISLRRRSRAVAVLVDLAVHGGLDTAKPIAAEGVPEKLSSMSGWGLRSPKTYGNSQPASTAQGRTCFAAKDCCGSSVVEHTLGKGEVESSILSGGTTFSHSCLGFFPNLKQNFH